ncbi:MAG: hypothetical protein CME07_02020 [Gemmatimonadetes bacterium]|jgi:hypothetical protein|nr:hypothetical protein [Gemmatimonadota bacterium]
MEDPAEGVEESCRVAITLAGPDRLRIRGTSRLFFDAFDLAVSSDTAVLLLPREKIAVVGPPDSPGWRELAWSPQDLLIALLAHPLAGRPLDSGAVRASADDSGLAGGNWRLEADPPTGMPSELIGGSGPELRIVWTDWQVRGGVEWPMLITIERGGRRLQLRTDLVQLDHAPSEGTFLLAPPEGFDLYSPGSELLRAGE